MKVKIALTIYSDESWYASIRGQAITNLSNKNDPEAVAHEAEKLFLNLLKELKENEKNKKARKEEDQKEEEDRSEREGCGVELQHTVNKEVKKEGEDKNSS